MAQPAPESATFSSLGKQIIGLTDLVEQMKERNASHFERVIQTDQQVIGLETSPNFPNRGQIDLRLSLSPLKDVQQMTQG